jgi:TniQ
MRLSYQTATEFGDLAVTKIPPRSRLYSLEPVGIGTPYVESMISYTARLADAHFVSPRRLFDWTATLPTGSRLTSASVINSSLQLKTVRFPDGGKSLNLDDAAGRYWLTALESLTLRHDLKYLTILPLSDAVSRVDLHRPRRTWCSNCLQDWKKAGKTIYEPLLWSFNAVEVCPAHKQKLVQVCHHCNGTQKWLNGRVRVGFCNLCYGWLGTPDYKSDTGKETCDQNGQDFLAWGARSVGELVASPDVFCTQWKKQSVPLIFECIIRTAGGNLGAFSKSLGLDEGTIYAWIDGKFQPRISHILKMAYSIGAQLGEILSGEIFQKRESDTFQSLAAQARCKSRRQKKAQTSILSVLNKALEENPPPSPEDVASALGYGHFRPLRKRFPEICNKIITRYKLSTGIENKPKRSSKRLHERETLSIALRQELDKEMPSALDPIASELGYKGAFALTRDFPELCAAIRSKRAEQRNKFLQTIRRELEQVVQEEPPPGVKAVSERFSRLHRVSIRYCFPDLYREISERHASYVANTRNSRIELALRTILDEDPPPPIEQVGERVGLRRATLYKLFPELVYAITARYTGYVVSLRDRKKAIFKEEVLKVVMRLYDSGIRPSRKLVWSFREIFSNKSFSAFVLTYQAVMQELGRSKYPVCPLQIC